MRKHFNCKVHSLLFTTHVVKNKNHPDKTNGLFLELTSDAHININTFYDFN